MRPPGTPRPHPDTSHGPPRTASANAPTSVTQRPATVLLGPGAQALSATRRARARPCGGAPTPRARATARRAGRGAHARHVAVAARLAPARPVARLRGVCHSGSCDGPSRSCREHAVVEHGEWSFCTRATGLARRGLRVGVAASVSPPNRRGGAGRAGVGSSRGGLDGLVWLARGWRWPRGWERPAGYAATAAVWIDEKPRTLLRLSAPVAPSVPLRPVYCRSRWGCPLSRVVERGVGWGDVHPGILGSQGPPPAAASQTCKDGIRSQLRLRRGVNQSLGTFAEMVARLRTIFLCCDG